MNLNPDLVQTRCQEITDSTGRYILFAKRWYFSRKAYMRPVTCTLPLVP
ncbi:MAG: hypothetical protein R6T90_07505 [Dissulfuribacterales bacterium]